MVDKTDNNTPPKDSKTPSAGDGGAGAITAAGEAEQMKSTAAAIASIHLQGAAARMNFAAEAAKAVATIHD